MAYSRLGGRLFALLKSRIFWTLTLGGNAIILLGSLLLFKFENNLQSENFEYFDALLWSVGTVTTIGYGNYSPHSFAGKFTLLTLMMSGTLFVWAYMAILVTGLIAPELNRLERDVHDVEKEIQNLTSKKVDIK